MFLIPRRSGKQSRRILYFRTINIPSTFRVSSWWLLPSCHTSLLLVTSTLFPTQVVFLDDLGSNLKPARDLGMVTILARDTSTALKELEKVTKTQVKSSRASLHSFVNGEKVLSRGPHSWCSRILIPPLTSAGSPSPRYGEHCASAVGAGHTQSTGIYTSVCQKNQKRCLHLAFWSK